MMSEERDDSDGRRSEADGPPSATRNEMGQARAADDDDEGRIPKVGKHEAGRKDSTGGELH